MGMLMPLAFAVAWAQPRICVRNPDVARPAIALRKKALLFMRSVMLVLESHHRRDTLAGWVWDVNAFPQSAEADCCGPIATETVQGTNGRSQSQRDDIFVETPRSPTAPSPVGAASTAPQLNMPPRWGLGMYIAETRSTNMPFLRNWPLRPNAEVGRHQTPEPVPAAICPTEKLGAAVTRVIASL